MRKIQNTKKLGKALIFDLDDTLYLESTFVKSGFFAAAAHIESKYGVGKVFLEELIDIFKRDGRGKVFDSALRKYGLYSRELVKTLVEVYRSHTPNIKPYPGLYRLLASLRNRYHLAIITDGVSSAQRNKIRAIGVEKLFDLIIYTDDCGKGKAKPNMYAFKKAIRYFKVSPTKAVYIGDDPSKDFTGPKKLNMITIRVLQGRFKDIKLPDTYEAEHTVRNIKEAIKLVELLDNK